MLLCYCIKPTPYVCMCYKCVLNPPPICVCVTTVYLTHTHTSTPYCSIYRDPARSGYFPNIPSSSPNVTPSRIPGQDNFSSGKFPGPQNKKYSQKLKLSSLSPATLKDEGVRPLVEYGRIMLTEDCVSTSHVSVGVGAIVCRCYCYCYCYCVSVIVLLLV
jgi:hypothetical protein